MEIRREPVHFAKAIFDETEINAVVDCLKKGWLGAGNITDVFEKRFAEYIGTKHSSLVNSGSSANLLAVRAMNLPPGSKVLTCAAGFPSTLAPIWHSHLIPVAVDLDLDTLNINLDLVEKALKKDKDIKGLIFAHTLGNPVDMKKLMALAAKYKIQVIEDNCDAIGSEIYGKRTGSFGNFSTCSFYASHHITLAGAGGIILTNDDKAALRIKSMKEWGKEQITTGFEPDHGVYFDSKSNGVPYDHRYSYAEIGYNFKVPELMAAFGLAQMDRLADFNIKRRNNFAYLYEKLKHLEKYFHFVKWHKEANPSWFNFPVTLRDGVGFTRQEIVEFLEKMNIKTRLFFAGNILRHKGYQDINVELIGEMKTADKVHKDSFLLGVHPAQTQEMLDYMVEVLELFIKTL